ncbi:AAA family ATPase [Ruania zhangjianzhongii]|uniref:AAA family ATPase n=1 Tax=Ruania zhangjianzhongii TaxID=2603206 RepID=UPI0011C81618|nr:AAA family ATPase [Ruania zhangjianzhongii]
MRIHRLRLVDFRGVADREVELPTSGVVVLQGENEVGKTSMIEAIDLLLDKPDSSKAREVREAKPVNRDVGPLVEADLSCGPYRFTYTKRWLRETRTELQVHSPRAASFTGAEAHAEVRRILDETLDTSLYQALRVLQASELTSAALAESSALAAALDQAAGTTGYDDDGDALLEAVNAEYATYFTPTGRETGEYASARKDLAGAEDAYGEAEHRLLQLARDVDASARLSAERDALSERLDLARRDLTAHEQSWQRLTGLRERVAEAQANMRTRSREHGWLTEAAERRASQDRALAGKVAAWEELTRRLDEAREQLHEARTEQRTATAAVETAQAEELRQRDLVDAANRAAERLQDLAELDRVRTRLATIEHAQATIEECEAILADSRIDAELLAAIDEADTELAVSRAQHEAAAARVQVTALTEVDVTVDGTNHPLRPEEELDAAVTEPVQVELPGTLRVSIAPARSSADTEAALTAARQRFEEVVHRAGVTDRRAAHRTFESEQRTRTEAARARERLDEELDGQSVSRLQAEQARLSARLTPGAERAGGGPDGARGEPDAVVDGEPGAPPSVTAQVDTPADAASAQAAKESAVQAHAAARDRSAEAAAARESFTQRAARLELDCTLIEGKATMAETDINDQRTALAAEREKTPDVELEEAADHAARQLTEAREAAAAAEAELADAPVEQIEAARTNALALTERLASESNDVEEQLRRLSVSLEMRGQEGLQEDYDTARTVREATRARLHQLDRRAQACRLLHETLHRARDAARSRYVRPFREQVVALGRIIYGTSFDVDVDEDLTIRSRTLDTVTVPFDQLSAGAREQLAIITRLACAAVVEPEQGVPVIIDDALGYSDPDRLERMNAMIGSLAADAQVILLTCTPDRYRGIGNASVIRLERSLPATG